MPNTLDKVVSVLAVAMLALLLATLVHQVINFVYPIPNRDSYCGLTETGIAYEASSNDTDRIADLKTQCLEKGGRFSDLSELKGSVICDPGCTTQYLEAYEKRELLIFILLLSTGALLIVFSRFLKIFILSRGILFAGIFILITSLGYLSAL